MGGRVGGWGERGKGIGDGVGWGWGERGVGGE